VSVSVDPRVDAYIAAKADFARPILEHLRAVVHAACPDVAETIKWGMPFFERAGRPLAHMAAFKQHCAFGFWQGSQVVGAGRRAEAMGQFGRIATLADLPPARELEALVERAVALIEGGTRPARARKTAGAKPAPEPPPDLTAAWRRNAAARRGYAALPPSHQREYVDWITEAKRAPTRARRVAQAIEWLAEGKSRNWKYERG